MANFQAAPILSNVSLILFRLETPIYGCSGARTEPPSSIRRQVIPCKVLEQKLRTEMQRHAGQDTILPRLVYD
jgi:hypothetical protein